MHPLLLRQLKKHLADTENIPSDFLAFLKEVSIIYDCANMNDALFHQSLNPENEKSLEELETIDSRTKGNEKAIQTLKLSQKEELPNDNQGKREIEDSLFENLGSEMAGREEAEYKSESIRSHLNKMANDLHLGLLEFDHAGNFIRANQSAADLFGCEREHVSAWVNFEKLVHADMVNSGTLEADLLSKRAFETTIHTAEGTERMVRCSVSFIRNFEGHYPGTVVTLFGIHEPKLKEVQLQTAHRNSEVALESRKVFLANISHEIRTPINAIVGMSGLLQQSDLSENQKEYVEALKSSSEGLMVLINDLLDVSKIESGKMDLEIIAFSLQKLSKNLVKSLGLKAEEKGLQLNWYIDPKVNECHLGDPTRITQIIANLIGNAIKFTRAGFVKLKIALLEQTDTTQIIQVTIADSGIGILPERLPSIFEQFTQEDSSTTRKYGGTGLGLSISKQLVELMGSELCVKSEKGKGSEFYFVLELPISSANQIDSDLHEVPDLSGVDVLLVEDNEINRFLALTIFKNWNANIVAVNNGLEAIDELKKKSYHLILMDLQMPYMDGFEAAKIIRGELKLSLPIIALTANTLNSERESCLQHGMNDYVTKPFQPDQLYKKIRAYLANIRYMQRREQHKAS